MVQFLVRALVSDPDFIAGAPWGAGKEIRVKPGKSVVV
jgi:hypothetical protein